MKDRAWLAYVRQLPCLCCQAPAEPHHLLRVPDGERGAGQKNGDRWAVPLCRLHHEELHRLGDERRFFAGYLDPVAWAAKRYQAFRHRRL